MTSREALAQLQAERDGGVGQWWSRGPVGWNDLVEDAQLASMRRELLALSTADYAEPAEREAKVKIEPSHVIRQHRKILADALYQPRSIMGRVVALLEDGGTVAEAVKLSGLPARQLGRRLIHAGHAELVISVMERSR